MIIRQARLSDLDRILEIELESSFLFPLNVLQRQIEVWLLQ